MVKVGKNIRNGDEVTEAPSATGTPGKSENPTLLPVCRYTLVFVLQVDNTAKTGSVTL
jgi:hypothetical protein